MALESVQKYQGVRGSVDKCFVEQADKDLGQIGRIEIVGA